MQSFVLLKLKLIIRLLLHLDRQGTDDDIEEFMISSDNIKQHTKSVVPSLDDSLIDGNIKNVGGM